MELSRPPDQDIAPVWAQMNPTERVWYIRFYRATVRFDWSSLRWLCELAPNANYERLYQEITYESNATHRNNYTSPGKRHPTFSEWDYGWKQPVTRRSATLIKNIILKGQDE